MRSRLGLILLSLILLSCSGNGCSDMDQPMVPCPPVHPPDPCDDDDDCDDKPDSLGAVGFERVFTPDDGLGPLFNFTSCVGCHEDPPGGPGDEIELHARSVGCEQLPGGPVFQLGITHAGELEWGGREEPPLTAMTAVRASPSLFASGLIDKMSDTQILSHVDPLDLDGDGVTGFASFLADGSIGRFGRKAQVSTLQEFIEIAYRDEMGVTTPGFVDQGPGGLPVPPWVDGVQDPEVSQLEIDAVVEFVRKLRLPPDRAGGRFGEKPGRNVFRETGCAACHIPSMGFTDVLMHSLGEDNGDICFEGVPPAYFRTEPLLGLRLKFGDGEGAGRFMHDGGSLTIEDAINRHDGEGTHAKTAFGILSPDDRGKLLEFLHSL